MKPQIIITIFLCWIGYIYAQHPITESFEKNKIWVKVRPEFKHIFKSPDQSSKLLKSLNSNEITTLFNHALINLDQKQKLLKTSRTQSNIDLELYYEITTQSEIDDLQLNKLKATGYFEIVERVAVPKVLFMPNDELSDSVTSHNGNEYKLINAYKAWGLEKGDTNVVIGVADLGADYNHIDLQQNIKFNYNDPIDGVDNDNDGYIDNFVGWDFAQGDPDVMSDGTSEHGTLVSGVCSAVANNDTLLTGSGFNCKFLPLKISSSGAIFINAAYNSIIYAATKGLKVINLSWTEGNIYSQIHQDIITKAVLDYDIAVVAAAGNSPKEIDFYPASYDHVLSVAGSQGTTFWNAATYSNFVDVSAPAFMQVLRDFNQTKYEWGSSISSPLVAGALALVRSKYPELNAIQAMERLRMAGTRLDTMPTYAGYKYLFGRRLDMYNALAGDPKSVRLTKQRAYSKNGDILIAEDTISVEAVFTNYLKPTTSNCKVKIRCDSSYIQLLNSEIELGALDTEEKVNMSAAFKFIIDKSAPKLSTVKFMLEYFDDGHYDYQVFIIKRININYLDLDTNHITLSIIDNGRMGFADMDATVGSGMKYKKANNSMYEAGLLLSTEKGKLSDCVRAVDTPKSDFVPSDVITYQSNSIADRHIVSTYVDTNTNGVKVNVTQNSFAWSDAADRNHVIIEYKLKNVSGDTIHKLNAAVFVDWDIPALGVNDAYAYSKNKVLWDSTNLLSISYNSLANGLYVGTKLLTADKPIFAALDNINVNGKFTDAAKLNLLNAGVSSTKAGASNSLGTDISELIGVSISNLKDGETATFAISFIVGQDILELQNHSRKALEKYKSIRTSPKPDAILTSVCKDSDVKERVGDDQIYKFYKNFTNLTSNYIKTDSLIQIENIQKDTIFYVTNHTDVFESEPVQVNIKVSDFVASNFNSLGLGNGKYLFYTNQSFSEILWKLGDGSEATVNNYVHDYTANGQYEVQMFLTNELGCKDSISADLAVSSVTLSLLSDIITDDIEVYPVPTKDRLFIDIPDHVQSNVYATITNLIGVSIGERYVLRNGKNSIDLIGLSNGIYFINIFVGGKVHKYKFIVA